MVRQLLEFEPGGRCARIGIVGNEVAPPQRQNIHADFARGELDQPFGHRRRDRMADGAVLAHHVLVLEHYARPRPVIRAGVGTAHQVDDLVRLDAAGARIDRIRADAGEIVDLERGDAAVVLDPDPRLDPVIARVNVGHEALDAVGHEFHRAFEQLRKRRGRHLIGIDVHLDAERAADVLAQHPHLVLVEPEMLGEDVLHHVRGLGALIDGEARFPGIPVGDDRARLERHSGVAAEHERRLDDGIRIAERLIDLAGVQPALEREVVAELGVDDRRSRIERGLRIGDGRERLVFDADELGRVLGQGTGLRQDGGDRLALPARLGDRDGVLRRRFQSLQMREHADPWRAHVCELGTDDDRGDAGRALCRRRIDRADPRMRVGGTHETDMHHARQHDVADELAAALEQALEIRPRYHAADIGVRPVERR